MSLSNRLKDLLLSALGNLEARNELVDTIETGGGGGGGNIKSDGSVPFTAPQPGVDPVSAPDLATKNYVDNNTVPDVNGIAATPVFIVAGGGIDVDTTGDTITITNTGTNPVGAINTFVGFDNNGDLESIPGFNIDLTSGGMNEELEVSPDNDTGGFNANRLNIDFSPLQNSPNDTWSIQTITANFDVDDSGFSQGSAGEAATLLNLTASHQTTGPIGNLNQIKTYFDLGNGTDPLTIKGLTYMFGFGDIRDNVTVNGGIQGYNFQPHIHSGAISTSNFSVISYADFANIEITTNGYSSFNASPIILEISNNHSYSGLNINPTITTFIGNAGYLGIGVSGNISTMSATGSYQAMLINPNITTSHGQINGILVTPNISGGDADFLGISIAPGGGAPLDSVHGLSINLSGVTTTDPQGPTGIESDSRIQINATTTLQSAQVFQIGSRLEHFFHVPLGSPVTGTDSLGVNLAGDIWAEDNIADGPVGLGLNSVGFITSVAVNAGKTIDTLTVFLPASALPDPGAATGGNITDMHMIRTFAPLSQGGTANITNLYGLKIDDFGGAFTAAATNTWGVFVEPTDLNNFFGGNVEVGSLEFNGSTSGSLSISPSAVTTSYSLVLPAAQGAAGTVMQNDGSGNLTWVAAGGGSGANTALSNLVSVAINTDLLPGSSGGPALGSNAKRFSAIHAQGNLNIYGGNGVRILDADDSDAILIKANATTTGYTILMPATQGAAGSALTNDGSGNLTWTVTTAGANTALSNLATTSINQNLLPSSDGGRNLGSSSLEWDQIYAKSLISLANTSFLEKAVSTPSGLSADSFHTNNSTTNLAIFTGSTTASKQVNIETGNASAGASGAITLRTGTASGARGNIIVEAGNLLPATDGSMDIGSSSKQFANIYANTTVRVLNRFNMGTGVTAPTGGTVDGAFSTNNAANIAFFTANTTVSKNLNVETGNASAGNSGNIVIQTGTATGTRGTITLSGSSVIAPLLAYSAASSPNWNGSPPTTVAAALDRIAAFLGPIP